MLSITAGSSSTPLPSPWPAPSTTQTQVRGQGSGVRKHWLLWWCLMEGGGIWGEFSLMFILFFLHGYRVRGGIRAPGMQVHAHVPALPGIPAPLGPPGQTRGRWVWFVCVCVCAFGITSPLRRRLNGGAGLHVLHDGVFSVQETTRREKKRRGRQSLKAALPLHHLSPRPPPSRLRGLWWTTAPAAEWAWPCRHPRAWRRQTLTFW